MSSLLKDGVISSASRGNYVATTLRTRESLGLPFDKNAEEPLEKEDENEVPF